MMMPAVMMAMMRGQLIVRSIKFRWVGLRKRAQCEEEHR
jgi:hypothetical protein